MSKKCFACRDGADIVKIDMALVRDIDKSPVKQSIVSHVLAMLQDLNITALCEGIETYDEMRVLQDFGVATHLGVL